ncbi:MAG: hypothetical protein JRF71_05370 [Deltaproteobacteria bacterium]|nr:hypothetical protein [Deltaproteobacteria bacterium]MBW2200250.1 hypothetical protein [Deltaproteobacteria bacterium]MBW2538968.1 hypothetical protein [Deltaproteobacteria bacterium]
MRKIRITAEKVTAAAVLHNNSTADAIWDALPIEARVNTWGEEIYFGIPVYLDEADDARATVDMGHLGYWPSGHAFCIFFGLTPASRGNEIRPASAVNVFGRIEGDATVFKHVNEGARIAIEKAET